MLRQQALEGDKDKGQTVVYLPNECAERMYSSTSLDGKEVIRVELRQLRERWEQYVDKLSALVRSVELCLNRWNSFNEHYRELDSWLKEIAIKVAAHAANDSLQDKKDALQQMKVGLMPLSFVCLCIE